MTYRIVVSSKTLPEASLNMAKVFEQVVREDDIVRRGGRLIEVRTEYPEEFISKFFSVGLGHLSFTCEMESL